MLYKFKNGTTQDPAGKHRTKIRLLQQFDEANLRLQYKFADWLERKTAHWSRRSWTIILIFFTIATSSCTIYVMVDSFSEPERSSIPITRILKTTNTIQTYEKMDHLKVLISKGENEKTIRFRRYKDNLGRSPTGKKIKDSINQNRPGLLDSLDKETSITIYKINNNIMEAKMKSPKMLRQRKILLIMPLLVLPFLTIIFWVLGGGKMNAENSSLTEKKGFNSTLPDANLKEGLDLDKMHYYDQAALDSSKLEELIRKDPNYLSRNFLEDSTKTGRTSHYQIPSGNSSRALNALMYRDPNEVKVHEKLEALQRVINTPVPPTLRRNDVHYAESSGSALHSEDVNKLEEMMQSMNTQNNEPDPELKQLSSMLESILDIQHPDRVQQKLRKVSESQRGQVFSIASSEGDTNISSLQVTPPGSTTFNGRNKQNAFYSLDEPVVVETLQNAVAAVIHETQTIVNGSTIKLRLSTAVFVNGVEIPKNNFLFGIASLQGERLIIKINSIRYKNALFPVELTVYDLDGLHGIYMPGAINREVAKASADRSVQTLGVPSLDDSWGAQAAGVGIEAVKTLFSKKAKLVKVVVKAGYQVLLRDEKQKQNESN